MKKILLLLLVTIISSQGAAFSQGYTYNQYPQASGACDYNKLTYLQYQYDKLATELKSNQCTYLEPQELERTLKLQLSKAIMYNYILPPNYYANARAENERCRLIQQENETRKQRMQNYQNQIDLCLQNLRY